MYSTNAYYVFRHKDVDAWLTHFVVGMEDDEFVIQEFSFSSNEANACKAYIRDYPMTDVIRLLMEDENLITERVDVIMTHYADLGSPVFIKNRTIINT